jgi:hypothetical protein
MSYAVLMCFLSSIFLVQKGKNDNRDPVTMNNLRERNVGAWVSCFFKKVETFLEVIVDGCLTKVKVKRKIVLKPNQNI